MFYWYANNQVKTCFNARGNTHIALPSSASGLKCSWCTRDATLNGTCLMARATSMCRNAQPHCHTLRFAVLNRSRFESCVTKNVIFSTCRSQHVALIMWRAREYHVKVTYLDCHWLNVKRYHVQFRWQALEKHVRCTCPASFCKHNVAIAMEGSRNSKMHLYTRWSRHSTLPNTNF